MKKTLVLGASENPARYSNIAVRRLKNAGHEVIAVGRREGEIDEIKIQTSLPVDTDIDTVTMYLNEENQKQYYDALLKLHPKRIIFNPGAENEELENLAAKKNIETIEACTLVLLSIGDY